MISAHPISGVGPGRFGTAFETFTSAKERQAAWPPLPVSLNWDPHSTWLGWAAETGLVGLAAWLVLFGWILRELLASRSWAARLAAAATLGLLANGFHVEVVHLKFVWAFLGLALGAAWASEGDKLIATGA
jgi:O-antigen ligase